MAKGVNGIRIALIAASSPEDAPYLNYYLPVFDRLGISYDLIFWDKKGSSFKTRNNDYVFRRSSDIFGNIFRKGIDYFAYASFVKKILKQNSYDRIIIFTIMPALFLGRKLLRGDARYIVDIRDYSPALKISALRRLFHSVAGKSYATVVSSPGFKEFLPKESRYILSHNISSESAGSELLESRESETPLKVLTLGLIRDEVANKAVVDALAANPSFELLFAGKGPILENIKEYALNRNIENISFLGPYIKSEEISICRDSDFINAFLSDSFNSSILLSNRLYSSVVAGTPVIVNKHSEQGRIVEKYDLGIGIDNTLNLDKILLDYARNFDREKYNTGRRRFMDRIRTDIATFEKALTDFAAGE